MAVSAGECCEAKNANMERFNALNRVVACLTQMCRVTYVSLENISLEHNKALNKTDAYRQKSRGMSYKKCAVKCDS